MRYAEDHRLDRGETLALARRALEAWIKAGPEVLHLTRPLTEADVDRYLLHEDGFLRVPVLVDGDRLVRGFTEPLYRQALGDSA